MNINKFTKVFLFFALILCLIQSSAQAYNTEIVKDGYTTASGGKKYDLIKGVFKFPAVNAINGKFIDMPARFFYSDGFFEEDPYRYNPSIATASICMAMAGFYSNEGGTGKNANYSNKSQNIVDYMKDIGVAEKNIYRNAYNRMRPQTDSIGVTIGMKKLSNGRTLIPVSIRGANYEREWTSNVTLGKEEDGEAKGFATAANIVFSEIKKYITQSDDLVTEINNGKVNFWISGYSRAGATTNLTAKRLVDEYVSKGNQVFAYCNEAPMGGVETAKTSGANYNCIHSVINRNDLVPRVAPKKMNFIRYGVDHYIPGTEAGTVAKGTDGNQYDNTFYTASSSEYAAVKTEMLKHLAAVNSYITFNDKFTPKGLKKVILIPPVEGNATLMNVYLDDLLDNLCNLTNLNRAVYTGGHNITSDKFTIYGDIQTALRNYMTMYFGSPKTETDEFKKRLLSIYKESSWKELFDIVWNALRKWDDPGFKYKAHYITKVLKWFKDKKCFDALESLTDIEKNKLMAVDLPIILNLLLTYASNDYWKRSPQYGTNGLAQILTLISNIENIGMNHNPEVTLAWLRAQDTLYKNETAAVTASSVINLSNVQVSETSNENAVIVAIEEIPDVYLEHGATNVKAGLPNATAWDSEGNSYKLSVTWNDPVWYVFNDTAAISEDLWKKIDESKLSETAKALMADFNGTVQTNGKKLAEGISTDITAKVYIAGLPQLEMPKSSLPEGEYDGPQKIILSREINDGSGDIEYRISHFIQYDDGATGGEGTWINTKYTEPITIGEGLTSSIEYALLAKVKSNTATNADSEEMIWYYKINPAKSDDGSGNTVQTTFSKVFTLSNDIAVCWSIDIANITVNTSSVMASAVSDNLDVTLSPSNASTVATKEVNVTVIATAGTTARGIYTIPVKTSTDGGLTWTTDATKAIKFNTSEETTSSVSSSGGGCNTGLTFCVIALLAVILFSKSKLC